MSPARQRKAPRQPGRRLIRSPRKHLRHLCIGLAALAFIRAGWWAAFHTFFTDLPLRDVSRLTSDGTPEPFRYDGVSYFYGDTLAAGQRVRMSFVAPSALARARTAQLEIFVRIHGLPDRPVVINASPDPEAHRDGLARGYGQLIVKRNDREERVRLDLAAVTLQRFLVAFPTTTGEETRITLQFEASEAFASEAADPDQIAAVSVAPVVVARSIWKAAIPWTIAGLLFAAGAGALAKRMDWPIIGMAAATVAACWVIQSGGFVSNEYFPGKHGSITGVAQHTGKLLSSGSFPDTSYRNGGGAVVPMLAAALEGGSHTFRLGYADVYPATRYVTWTLGLLALLVLQVALARTVGMAIALLTGLLYSCHHVVMVLGLFHNDVDGFLLPWCMLAVACYIRMLHSEHVVKYAVGVGIALFGMTAIKITPAFMPILFGLGWWIDEICRSTQAGWRRVLAWRPPVAALAWLAAVAAGSWIGLQAHSPDRNVGIEGEPFQKSTLWHMLWAAGGQYDHYGAHGFTKSGGVRNERVAARTGLDVTTYLRQSQRATREVYKPDLAAAFRERPFVFLSNSSTRFVRHGLQFFRITRGEYDDLDFKTHYPPGELASGTKNRMPDEISGEYAPPNDWPVRLTRYGKYWKVAPLATVGWLTVELITPPVDAALIIAAIAGCVLIRRPGLVVVLLGLIAAKYTFATSVHAVNRYFLFSHAALLIGLATFLVVVWRALRAAGPAARSSESEREDRTWV